MTIPWYATALGAALVWGLHYPLVDHALRRISLVGVLLLTAVPILLLIPPFFQTLTTDYRAVSAMPWHERLPIFALALTSLTASVLLFLSIGGKNATLASLIEISYPVFVALFTFVLFRQVTVNASVMVGAAFVFLGVAIIILHNR